ncbi:fungal-specific transcription factor domain-containing protein [Penicillium atrosanguineum]|nr:fungal-specific transcription factor domain-containing protein [Penicillium atrosanguineum]KAJ5137737.1 fungal-specific transcription factor domain-containing protein [Penicillium atrosanguineum]
MPQNIPAKVACRRCHKRRVRCDRSEGKSCSQCRTARINCEPILSRRGRHRKLPFADVLTTSTQPVLPNVPASSTVGDAGPTHSRINERLDSRREHHEGPHVRLSDTGTGSMSSLPALRSSGRTPYVTDPSNINYLIREFGYPGQNATDVLPIEEYLRRAMLEWLGSPTIELVEGLRSSTIGRLKNEGAFDLPSGDISAALLNAFFQHPFPSLSVIERSDFMKSIETGTVSHLLLNAIYMVATIYCPDSVIDEAGFATRYVASLTFYNRAKDIYDTGYETDAVVVIQATFLLSHWWSDPLEQKDPWYWLGITAGMAQLLGMDRLACANGRRCANTFQEIVFSPSIETSQAMAKVMVDNLCPCLSVQIIDACLLNPS